MAGVLASLAGAVCPPHGLSTLLLLLLCFLLYVVLSLLDYLPARSTGRVFFYLY